MIRTTVAAFSTAIALHSANVSTLAPKDHRAQIQAAGGNRDVRKSVGYLTADGSVPGSLIAAFSPPVSVLDTPGGKALGELYGTGNRGLIFRDARRQEKRIRLSEELGHYTGVLLVYGQRGSWLHVRPGWIKAPAGLGWRSWRTHYSQEPDANRWPYIAYEPLPLLLEKGGKATASVDGFIYILASRDGWALVMLSPSSDSGCESGEPLSGKVGWLKIVDDDGHPLITQVFGSC